MRLHGRLQNSVLWKLTVLALHTLYYSRVADHLCSRLPKKVFFKMRRSVACVWLMIVLAYAQAQQISDSESDESGDMDNCPVERLESQLSSVQDQLSRMQEIVSTLNNPLIKENCIIDLAAYGYDDPTKYGYIRTSGGSSESTYAPVQIDMYRGVTVVELDPTTCITRRKRRYDTHSSTYDIAQLVETLDSATTGKIFVGVTADSAEDIGLAFQNNAGLYFNSYNMNITGLRMRDKFVFVMQKDYPTKTLFQRKPHDEESLRMKVALRGTSVYDVTFHRV